jgi:hypothetical protein
MLALPTVHTSFSVAWSGTQAAVSVVDVSQQYTLLLAA